MIDIEKISNISLQQIISNLVFGEILTGDTYVKPTGGDLCFYYNISAIVNLCYAQHKMLKDDRTMLAIAAIANNDDASWSALADHLAETMFKDR